MKLAVTSQVSALTAHPSTSAIGRVQAFLDSQRNLAPFYAAKGKEITATWAEHSGDSSPKSPMLLPRAAIFENGELNDAATHSAALDKYELPFQPPSRPVEPQRSPKQSSRPNLELAPTKSKKPGVSRPTQLDRDLSDESGRSERLAKRRNRSRARRATAKAAVENSISGESSLHGDTGKSKKKRQKTQNKTKKNKVAPALLLMQTFSGQNMGKSRLTIKPSATVGVFNKGKISAKVHAKPQQTGRSVPDIVFSESAFLKKARPTSPSESDISEDNSYDSDAHSDHSIVEHAKHNKSEATMLSTGTICLSKEVSQGRKKATSPLRSLQESVRGTSPPWDIEYQLVSPSIPSPKMPPKVKPSVIRVDRCPWNSKLRKLNTHTTIPQVAISTPASPKPSQKQPPATSSYFSATQAPLETPLILSSPMLHCEHTEPLVAIQQGCMGQIYPEYCDSPVSPVLQGSSSLPCTEYDYMDVSHDLAPPHHLKTDFVDFTHSENNGCTGAGDGYEDWRPGSSGSLPIDYTTKGDEHAVFMDTNQDMPKFDNVHSNFEPVLNTRYEVYDGEADVEYHNLEDIGGYEDTSLYQPYGNSEFDYQDARVVYGEDLLDNSENSEHPLQWEEAAVDEEPENEPTPMCYELELVDQGLLDEDTIENSLGDQTLRIFRMVTEASLENDFRKSISNHWSIAHRLG